MTDPVEAIRTYEQQVHDIAARAGSARDQLAALRPSASSADGAVTVTVTAAGALADLTFGPAAADLDLGDLARLVVRTAQTARLEAARQTEAAVAGLIGASAAHDVMASQFPGADGAGDSPPAAPDDDEPGYRGRSAR